MLRYIGPNLMSDPTAPVDAFLPSFLQLTPNLQDLTLQLDNSDPYNAGRANQDALILSFDAFALSAPLPRIKVLDLGCATVGCGDLVYLWKRVLRTVERVRLREIGLWRGAGGRCLTD
jgi:hypothetical protein